MLFRKGSTDLLLFLMGLFSMTQIRLIGSIGISELVCYLVSPILFILDYNELRRDGFMPTLILALLALMGCCLSSWHNNTPFPAFIRGFAVLYSLFALPVAFHRLLKNNLTGIKWMLLGTCLSSIINVFVFRPAVEVSMAEMLNGGDSSIEAVMSGPLFWLQRLGAWLTLPIGGWYFDCPFAYMLVAPFVMTVFTIASTDSGRSAFAITTIGVFLLFLGRKTISGMKTIQRYFFGVVICVFVIAVALKTGYNFLAANGMLNEKAQRKYEGQLKGGTSLISMLVGGRSETFAGVLACLDNPIWGFGPWSLDEKGYYAEFLSKYGDIEDYQKYCKALETSRKAGYIAPPMPSHSHIIGFWVRYGILALPFWVYIVYCMYRHLRHNMVAIPQWYGYFSLSIANMSWGILFSPYGGRVSDCLFVSALLIANSVRLGRIQLPIAMIEEVMKHDRKAIKYLWNGGFS